MNIPDFQEFLKGCEKFAKHEKRDAMYKEDDMIKVRYDINIKVLFMMLFFLTLTSLAYAADENNWMIEVNGGVTAIHDTAFNGTFFSIRGAHSLAPDNSVILDFGFMCGSTRTLYGGWFAGIKYRFRSDKIVSPFIHTGIGTIQEEDRGSSWVLTAAAGIDINISQRLVVPITFQIGAHRFFRLWGPHAISVGLGYRF